MSARTASQRFVTPASVRSRKTALTPIETATMRVIRQNVAVSIGVKAVFLLLTLAGVTNLWLAVLADMGTSLLVTLNALRLVRPGWWSADDPAPAPAPDARMAPSAAAD